MGGTARVIGPDRFTLAGLDFQQLTIRNVPGRALIDDISVGTVLFPAHGLQQALLIQRAGQLLLQRSTLYGRPDDTAPFGTAVRIVASHAVLLDSHVTGGGGLDASDAFDDAIVVEDSTLVLRGGGSDSVHGGPIRDLGGEAGNAIALDSSLLLHGGVQLYTTFPTFVPEIVATDDSTVLEISPAEPYLETQGGEAAGKSLSIDLYGPAGTLALLAVSVSAPASLPTLAGYEGAFWLDPGALLVIVPFTLTGQDTAPSLAATIPESEGLEGLAIHLQAFFPGVPGALDPALSMAGNPAALVVRF